MIAKRNPFAPRLNVEQLLFIFGVTMKKKPLVIVFSSMATLTAQAVEAVRSPMTSHDAPAVHSAHSDKVPPLSPSEQAAIERTIARLKMFVKYIDECTATFNAIAEKAASLEKASSDERAMAADKLMKMVKSLRIEFWGDGRIMEHTIKAQLRARRVLPQKESLVEEYDKLISALSRAMDAETLANDSIFRLFSAESNLDERGSIKS